MTAPLYTPSGEPVAGSAGSSSILRTEFTAIETGLDQLNSYPIVSYFADANTAGQIYVAVPWDCICTKIQIVNEVANTTAATTFTAKIVGTAVTDGAATLAAAAAQATVTTITPSALNQILQGQAIELESDGGGSPVMPCQVTFLFERT